MITDSRPIWDAPLAEILSQPATSGTRASATDVPGVNLEWMTTDAYPTGAWFGDCGQPTLAQLNALPTAYLATGARASVLGVQYTYGAGSAWKAVGGDALLVLGRSDAAWKRHAGYESSGASVAVAADTTLMRKHVCPFYFYGFTVFLENYGTSPMVYDNVSVRVGGNGNQGTSVRLTKDASTTITVPAAAVDSDKRTTPGVVELDFIADHNLHPLTSIGGQYTAPVNVWIRAHTTTGGKVANMQALTTDSDVLDLVGSVAGDQVTIWSAQTISGTTGPGISFLRLRTSRTPLSILLIGDSLTQNAWPDNTFKAINATLTKNQIVWHKAAIGGVGSKEFLSWARLWIPLLAPDIVYVPAYTPNDGGGTEITQLRQRTAEVMRIANQYGCRVVTSTPFPNNGTNASSVTNYIVPISQQIRASGLSYLDFADVMADAIDSNKYKDGYSSDGLHPNATGQVPLETYTKIWWDGYLKTIGIK